MKKDKHLKWIFAGGTSFTKPPIDQLRGRPAKFPGQGAAFPPDPLSLQSLSPLQLASRILGRAALRKSLLMWGPR